MRNRFGVSVLFAGALTLSLILLAGVAPPSEAKAQGSTAKESTFNPRDLSGVWGSGVRITTGLEHSPFTPWGKEQFDADLPFQNVKGSRGFVLYAASNDPMVVCDPLGFPRNIFTQDRHMKFIQTPDETIQLFQYQRIWRQIWTDGRKLPTNAGKPGGPDLLYYGYSVGHWDGNTFVVDTTGLTPTTWLDVYGSPHSSEMTVEERYTRLDPGHLKLTVTITDPKAYTKPFEAISGYVYRLATRASVATQIAWPDKPLPLPEQMCIPSEALTYLKDVAESEVEYKIISPYLQMPLMPKSEESKITETGLPPQFHNGGTGAR
jgi:hypothetical protein